MCGTWRSALHVCLTYFLLIPFEAGADIRSMRHTPKEWDLAWGRQASAATGYPQGLRGTQVSTLPGLQAASGRNDSGELEIWVRSFSIHPATTLPDAETRWRRVVTLPREFAGHRPVVAHDAVWIVDDTTSLHQLTRHTLDGKGWETIAALPDLMATGMRRFDARSLHIDREGRFALQDVDRAGMALIADLAGGGGLATWSFLPMGSEELPGGMDQLAGQFDIARPGQLLSLVWQPAQGSQLSYRTSLRTGEPYGPWSDSTSTSPVTINMPGQFLQYRIERKAGPAAWPSDSTLTYQYDEDTDRKLAQPPRPDRGGNTSSAGSSVGGGNQRDRRVPTTGRPGPVGSPQTGSPQAGIASADMEADTDEPTPAPGQREQTSQKPSGETSDGSKGSPEGPSDKKKEAGRGPEEPQEPAQPRTVDPGKPSKSPGGTGQESPEPTPEPNQESTSPRSPQSGGGKAAPTPQSEGIAQDARTADPDMPQDSVPSGAGGEGSKAGDGGNEPDSEQNGESGDDSSSTDADSGSPASGGATGGGSGSGGSGDGGPGAGGEDVGDEESRQGDDEESGEENGETPDGGADSSSPDQPSGGAGGAGSGSGSGSGSGTAESGSGGGGGPGGSGGDAGGGPGPGGASLDTGGDATGDASRRGSEAGGAGNDQPGERPGSSQPDSDSEEPASDGETAPDSESSDGKEGQQEVAQSPDAPDVDGVGSVNDLTAAQARWGNANAPKTNLGISPEALEAARNPRESGRLFEALALGLGACGLSLIVIVFIKRRRRRAARRDPEAQNAAGILDAGSASGDTESADDTPQDVSAADDTPSEQVREGGEPLEWADVGDLPGDWSCIAAQHREYVYAVDDGGRIFRLAQADVGNRSDEDEVPQPHCFSPIRRDPMALVASPRSLVAVGTLGVGEAAVVVAELDEEGEVASWHTSPYPDDPDGLAAIAVRGSKLWLIGAEGQTVRLFAADIQAGRPARAWNQAAQLQVRGELLAGAIVPRMAVALMELPSQPGSLSVFTSTLGEKAEFRRVVDLPWSGRDVTITAVGPQLLVLDRGPGPGDGRLSRVPLQDADRPSAWITGPSGLDGAGRALVCQPRKGRLLACSRQIADAGDAGTWHLAAAHV